LTICAVQMAELELEEYLEFDPLIGGHLTCPLCSCTFPRWVDREGHILRFHLAKPTLMQWYVVNCLIKALTWIGRSPCPICPPEHSVMITNEDFLDHMLVIHLSEPARLAELCPLALPDFLTPRQ
jgi:hypothetical protein